ncbi:hypothetical protein BHE74_00024848 [Ensete ventricosum]|nr:hypothetical protein BHE74_00024848 [Ensete ventricosum]
MAARSMRRPGGQAAHGSRGKSGASSSFGGARVSLVVTLKAQKAQQIGPCEPCGPITIPNDARIPPPPASPSCRQDPHLHRQRRGGRRGEDEEEALPPVRRGIGAPPDEPRTREQRSSRLLFEGSSGWSEAEEEASGRLQLFVIIGIKTMGSIRHPI